MTSVNRSQVWTAILVLCLCVFLASCSDEEAAQDSVDTAIHKTTEQAKDVAASTELESETKTVVLSITGVT